MNLIPSPAMMKMHLKMLFAEVACCMYMLRSRTYLGIQTNSVDPDQTVPRGAGRSGSTLFAIEMF